MARTQGHGNPDWTRDETILALDLFLSCGSTVLPPTDARVQALSALLRSLPLHQATGRQHSFRNPAGVGFKLQNLQQVATGRGLPHVSEVDRQVWADLGTRPENVREIAALIRAGAHQPELFSSGSQDDDDDHTFFEGRIVTVLHKIRERDRSLRKRLLASRWKHGGLTCDLCARSSPVLDPKFEDATFEAHHLNGVQEQLRLADMALLCACCHRLLHRAIAFERRWLSLPEARKTLGFPPT